jgi:hypothetical protein
LVNVVEFFIVHQVIAVVFVGECVDVVFVVLVLPKAAFQIVGDPNIEYCFVLVC